MLDLWIRWIQFHELHVKREPEHAPFIALDWLVSQLKQRVEKEESHKMLKKDTASIRIKKLKTYPEEKVVVLLMQYADTNVTDPVFQGLESGDLRTEPKLDGEGIAVSNHVAISLAPKAPDSPFYAMAIEEVPGLARSNIGPFLKSEFKIVAEGLLEFNDEEHNGEPRVYRPAAEVEAVASISLRGEVESGSVVNEIKLISHKPKGKKFDEDAAFKEVERTITLKVQSPEGILDKLQEIRVKARDEGYPELKLRYCKIGGKQKTALIGTTKGDVADALLGRTERIEADEVLAQCRDEICESIAKKMVDYVAKPKD